MAVRWFLVALVLVIGSEPAAQESRAAARQEPIQEFLAKLRKEPEAARAELQRRRQTLLPRLLDVVANGSLADCLVALDGIAALGADAGTALPALLETAAALPDLGPADTGPFPVPSPDGNGVMTEGMVLEPHLVHALSRMGSKAVKPMVNDLLGTDRQKRAFAIRTLGAMGRDGAAAVAPLRHVLRNAERDERVRIVDTLGYIGSGASAAIGELMPDLDGSDPELRMTAARALWGIGRPAIPALVNAVSGASSRGRRAAAWALAAIARTEQQAVWVLPRLLVDEDEVVRHCAVEGLRAARELPAPLRDRLRELAERDPSYHVRLSAEVTVVLRDRAERGVR